MLELSSDLAKHLILTVDDEPDNLQVLKTTLEVLHGASVCIATSCDDALAQLATFHPTMIITDLSMPHADGYKLLELLRQREDTAPLPIVALTAHAMNGDRERILAAGFDGYVSKPFEVGTIGMRLEKILTDFIARQSTAPRPSSSPTPQPPIPLVQPSLGNIDTLRQAETVASSKVG